MIKRLSGADSLVTRLTVLLVVVVTVVHAALVYFLFLGHFDQFLIEQEQTQYQIAEEVLRDVAMLRTDEDADDLSFVDRSGVIGAWWQEDIPDYLENGFDQSLEKELRGSANLPDSVGFRTKRMDLDVRQMAQTPTSTEIPLNSETRRQLRQLHIAVELKPGRWLHLVIAAMPRSTPPAFVFIAFFGLTWVALLVAAIVAAHMLTRPFRALSVASETMAKGEFPGPIELTGPPDVQRPLIAFNKMSESLKAVFESQRELLLAIGHDLRTPITSLRIRSEFIDDENERRKITRSLDQLQCLTESALEAGRTMVKTDPKVTLDLTSMVEMVCEELSELGMEVTFSTEADTVVVQAWPDELSRAIRNLIENAVRYGSRADVSLVIGQDQCHVVVDDQGPGIPEDRMEDVFRSLTRLDTSRNLDTGGHGLGLYIARNIVLAHDGKITLQNRHPKGLSARMTLPISKNLEAK